MDTVDRSGSINLQFYIIQVSQVIQVIPGAKTCQSQ